jgi:hypothetical protein
MALIKLGKRSESGQDAGTLILNTDHIVALVSGANATEIQTADGRSHWVRETPEQVFALVSSSVS